MELFVLHFIVKGIMSQAMSCFEGIMFLDYLTLSSLELCEVYQFWFGNTLVLIIYTVHAYMTRFLWISPPRTHLHYHNGIYTNQLNNKNSVTNLFIMIVSNPNDIQSYKIVHNVSNPNLNKWPRKIPPSLKTRLGNTKPNLLCKTSCNLYITVYQPFL